MAAKPVGDHGVRNCSCTTDEVTEEALGSGPIPPRLDQTIDDDAVLIDSTVRHQNRVSG